MKPVIIPVIALIILCFVLSAGCTSGTAPAPATTIATPAPAPVTSVPATKAVTVAATTAVPDYVPIEPLPSAQQVNLALTKDRPTAEIHLLYEGGPGDVVTKKITLWVYAADGTYTEYVMTSGKKPIPGDEIVAPGTRGGDRCVVFVNSAGKSYRVIDEKVYAGGEYR